METAALTLLFGIFPFGQLLRLQFDKFALHPIDMGVFLVVMLSLTKIKGKHWRLAVPLLSVFVFSYLQSLFIDEASAGIVGLFYLVRIVFYILFFMIIWGKDYLSQLYLVLVVVLIFGYLQYLFLPDLRFIRLWGWDDHLYRMVGSFLDPGYFSILSVIGGLVSYYYFLRRRSNWYLLGLIGFGMGVVLSFSRAGYLAFVVGMGMMAFFEKKYMHLLAVLVLFGAAVIYAPKPLGEGVNLGRVYSIELRAENYKDTAGIFVKYPVYGVGYNNLCAYRGGSSLNHACAGADSSLLYLLATTGVVGLMVVSGVFGKVLDSVGGEGKGLVFSVVGAIFLHSFSANTLFYPWVVTVAAVVIGRSLR